MIKLGMEYLIVTTLFRQIRCLKPTDILIAQVSLIPVVVTIFLDMNPIYFPIGLGLGLAVWKDVDSYKDIAHIAATLNLSVITALNNKNLHDCNGSYDSSTSCDGQLVIFNMNYGEARLHPYNFFKVWQQTKNGSEETFTHIQAYGR